MSSRMVGRRQVFLQPKKFWDFHLGRDGAADIAKNLVMGVVDQTGLGNRAVVHPDNHIAAFVARRADGQWIGAGVKHHQRASGVETHALDGGWRKSCFRHRRADRGDARYPDLGRRLFDDVARLMPNCDRVPGRRQQRSLFVEHSRARTRCSNVNTDEGLLHSNPVQDPRKPTSTYSPHRRERHSRSSGLRHRRPETGRPTQLRRPPPFGPSAYHRSRHHTSAGCS